MPDFAAARRIMVDSQLRTNEVSDRRLIAAMLELPRERFVASRNAPLAYLDFDLPVGEGASPRRFLKPMVLAKLIQAAEVGAGDRVLDVGCGTGYSSAVLARLAGAVVALEEDPVLAERARDNLAAVRAENVKLVTGPLPQGWLPGGAYDVILLNGSVEVEPAALLEQLRPGGRLVGVVGRAPASRAMRYVTSAGRTSGSPIFDAAAAPLPGFCAPAAFVF